MDHHPPPQKNPNLPTQTTRNLYDINLQTLHTMCWAPTHVTSALEKELMSQWPCTLYIKVLRHKCAFIHIENKSTYKMSTCSLNSLLWTVKWTRPLQTHAHTHTHEISLGCTSASWHGPLVIICRRFQSRRGKQAAGARSSRAKEKS